MSPSVTALASAAGSPGLMEGFKNPTAKGKPESVGWFTGRVSNLAEQESK